MAEKYLIQVNESLLEGEIEHSNGRGEARVRFGPDSEWQAADLHHVRAGLHVVMLDNRPVELYIERSGSGVDVTIGRRTYHIQIARGRRAATMAASIDAASDGFARIRAPMTGTVLEVRAAPGDEVEAGDVLVVIESMKMNNELRAPAAGVVERIDATVDAQVEEGQELVAIRAAEAKNGSG
ncbi:MAG: biotin/lipoyl-binding protein [Dehalococcoidia bacterium]|nr:biotin/lipoyl-binding protein [Dehalococcoidia bacterium]MYA52332.1 biotin/lipoyl-binding protein [Dehalococcoidia bacterium]